MFPEVTAEWEANRPDAKTGQGAVPGGRLGLLPALLKDSIRS